MSSSNFNFLEPHDTRLVQLGALAERYFADDPSTTKRPVGRAAAKLMKGPSCSIRPSAATLA
jgi:type I restriction enzyme R subunit